jgi:F-type H+-transporting ATPase subunit O
LIHFYKRVAMAARHLSILTRQFSTCQARHAIVKTPVPVYGIEGRYAAALYSAANKNGALEAVEKDLAAIAKVIKTDPRLGDFLLDPSVKKGLKLDGINGVCKTLKVNDLSKNLLLAIAENNRFTFIGPVVASYNTLMAAHRGEVVCVVTTAKALDAPTKKEVEGALAGFLKKGEKALISYAVDPVIVGGMVVSIADKFVDMSMSTKLTKYSDLIKGAA